MKSKWLIRSYNMPANQNIWLKNKYWIIFRIRPVFQPSRGLQSPNNANIQQHQNSNPSKRHRERLNNELDRVARYCNICDCNCNIYFIGDISKLIKNVNVKFIIHFILSLLPYEEHVLQRLDKLSVLRLAVAFIQTKTHFRGKAIKISSS